MKGKGYILCDVVCKGMDGKCGKEFVVKENEAVDPTKACVPSGRNPAWWCEVCHVVYCTPCYQKCVSESTTGGTRKRVAMHI
jgi:hypothetical protein